MCQGRSRDGSNHGGAKVNPWFRFYHAALDDPKVQKLDPKLFKAWVNLLCLACRNDGRLPSRTDIAFALRCNETEAVKIITTLVYHKLIDGDGSGGYQPHNWEERQFKSDGSKERVQRFRERHRNATGNVTETADETGPDSEQNRTEIPEAKASGSERSKSIDVLTWEPDAEDRQYAVDQGRNPDRVLADIRGWAANKPPAKRRKRDPRAFWQGWCRRAADRGEGGSSSDRPSKSNPGQYVAPGPASQENEKRRLEGYRDMIKKRQSPGMNFTPQIRHKMITAGMVTMEECEAAGCSA